MLVPPWNRISASILPYLRELGYRALSCHGTVRADAPVPVFNTHVDLIDWRASRRSRDHASLVRDVVMHIRRAAPAGGPAFVVAPARRDLPAPLPDALPMMDCRVRIARFANAAFVPLWCAVLPIFPCATPSEAVYFADLWEYRW